MVRQVPVITLVVVAGVAPIAVHLLLGNERPLLIELVLARPGGGNRDQISMGRRGMAPTFKNVVIVDLRRKCIGFLSRTYVGKTHEKKIADSEGISYPPKAELYKDTGFQGYEPAVTRTCQAKKSRPEGNSQPLRSERTGSSHASESMSSMPSPA